MNTFKRTSQGLLLSLVVLLGGCGYGKVSSNTYEYAKALYSTCNRQDAKNLQKAATMIETAHSKGDLSDQEAGWLKDIVTNAEAGDWARATSQARRMMKDQVDGSP